MTSPLYTTHNRQAEAVLTAHSHKLPGHQVCLPNAQVFQNARQGLPALTIEA